MSVQASVLNLLADLQRDLGFACLFITHDLAAVEYLADEVAVMYLGRLHATPGGAVACHLVGADGAGPDVRVRAS